MSIIGLMALVAVVLALAPASASAVLRPTTYVLSADSGRFAGDRLVLSGVERRVTWVSHGRGRGAGALALSTLHDRLFARPAPRGWPGSTKPAPARTAALNIAGQASSNVAGLDLSRPRYNAARQTVSYRVKRLSKSKAPMRAARASGIPMRPFGAASLSITALGSPLDIYHCSTSVLNYTYYTVEASGENKWDTDSWNPGIPFQQMLTPGADNVYGSDGGFMRGCGNSSTWTIIDGPPGVQGTTFSLSATIPYGGEVPGSIQGNCSSDNSAFKCIFDQGSANTWYLAPASAPSPR